MSQKVHDVQKVSIVSTFYVLICLVVFYMFILDEIHLRSHILVYEHNWVGNVEENLSKDQLIGP